VRLPDRSAKQALRSGFRFSWATSISQASEKCGELNRAIGIRAEIICQVGQCSGSVCWNDCEAYATVTATGVHIMEKGISQ
jgi:hypothetical protein